MSTVASDRPDSPLARTEAEQVEAAAPEATGGDPAMIGVPTFVIGSIALGLVLTGYAPKTAGAAALPIIMGTTGIGQIIAALWASRLGQSAVASIFGIFSGFWISYSLLLLGLAHNWYGVVAKEDVQGFVSSFLLTWVIAVAVLTLVTLRLPAAFTLLFIIVDLALILVLLGNENPTSPNLTKAGGYAVFAFAAIGVYLFAGAASVATGGKAFGLGRPVIR